MIYTTTIIASIAWVYISKLFGMFEANMFHNNSKKGMEFKIKYGFDIHILFTAIRVVPALILFLSITGLVESFLFSAFMILSFPYFHDNAYYVRRKYLSEGKVYPKGKYSQSTTTSAKLSFRYNVRVILLRLSALFLLSIFIKNVLL